MTSPFQEMWRWLAIRTKRPCPECQKPITSNDQSTYFGGEVYHRDCISEKLGS